MKNGTGIQKGVYFAAVEDPHQLAAGMKEKIQSWRTWCKERGLIGLWKKKLVNYYGNSMGGNSSQALTQGGSEGELTMFKVNDLHNLIQNQLVLVTGKRPAGIARAINSDSASLKDARIGSAVAEHYMVGFEEMFVKCAETALLVDEAYTLVDWDEDAGDPIAVDPFTGQPEMSGDIKLSIQCPWNVARDPGVNSDDNKWNIITFKKNKFDTAAKYERFSEQIINADDDFDDIGLSMIPECSDAIYMHLLLHDRTPAVPNGRYALLIGDTIVSDMDFPYPEYNLRRMTAEDVIEGCTGYSPSNDIMALEELTDGLHSVVATNQITFGGQSIVGPSGCDLNHTELAKGVRFFQLPPDQVDKLKPLDLLHTSPEIFAYLDRLDNKKEQQVGVNSVVRGQPEGQLSGASGSALALIQSQAISFNSGTQRSYFGVMSGTMTCAISILRVYADSPRMARLVGKTKSPGLKEFKWTGKDLKSVSSIVYEVTNAVSQTQAGRMTIAQDLLAIPGMIKSPKQYITLINSGSLDPMMEDDEADQLIILEENEWLIEGKPFKAVITQMHSDHIRSHTSQITLELQQSDPQAVARILMHVQDHIDLWTAASYTNPGILLATNQQPLLLQGQPMGGQGQEVPGSQPSGPRAVPNPKKNNQISGPNYDVIDKAEQVRQPNLPMIAGSQQRAQIPGVS